jgi:septation ring formation regulator EzrA
MLKNVKRLAGPKINVSPLTTALRVIADGICGLQEQAADETKQLREAEKFVVRYGERFRQE